MRDEWYGVVDGRALGLNKKAADAATTNRRAMQRKLQQMQQKQQKTVKTKAMAAAAAAAAKRDYDMKLIIQVEERQETTT